MQIFPSGPPAGEKKTTKPKNKPLPSLAFSWSGQLYPKPIPKRPADKPDHTPCNPQPMAARRAGAPPLTQGHADALPAVARPQLAPLEGAAAAAHVRPLSVHLLQQQRQLALKHLQLPLGQQVLAPPQLLRLGPLLARGARQLLLAAQ